jgi:hypothetical protein
MTHSNSRIRKLAFAGAAVFGCAAAAGSAQGKITLVPPAESVCKHCTPPLAIQAPIPPRGFNPVTASDDQLAFYGFPPRPDALSAPGAYSAWHTLVTLPVQRVTTGFQQTTIYNRPADILSTGQKTPGSTTTGASSSNWSGYTVEGSNNVFNVTNTTIYGVFEVPVAQQAFGSCTGGWDYSSQWIGIDGWGSSDVFQAGYEADAYCSGGSTSQFYSAWYEWYPNSETRISGFPANPGDIIYLYIWPTSTTTGEYYIANLTADEATSASFSAPSGTHLQGNSIEWIVERPGVNGSLATLTNYVNVPWYYATATVPKNNGTTTQYSPADGHSGTILSITMDDNSGNGISDAFTSKNNDLTYVAPNGDNYYYSGTALWFYDFGSAY